MSDKQSTSTSCDDNGIFRASYKCLHCKDEWIEYSPITHGCPKCNKFYGNTYRVENER